MTYLQEATDNTKTQSPQKPTPQLYNSISKSDWQMLQTPKSGTGEPASGQLSMDGDIYSQNVKTAVSSLSADEKALKGDTKGSSAYQQDLTKLSTDEKTLRTDVFALKDHSATYADFTNAMEPNHAALKSIANGLYGMGLKDQASQTTAYFPLDHYEHDWSKSGGSGGTLPDLPNGQKDPNLESEQWHDNTKDKGKDGIGGSGDDPQIQTSYKDGVLTYSSTGGPGADTLISNKQMFKPDDNTFLLKYDMNRSAATAGNEQASEHDMVITNSDGYQAQAASQFNYSEKAPPGMVWFQTSQMNGGPGGKWINSALVPIPKPGEWTNVAMEVKIVGNQYEYTGLNINGKSYNFLPGTTTFDMEKKNWTRDSVITQFQEDLNGKGGSITQEYKDVEIESGIT